MEGFQTACFRTTGKVAGNIQQLQLQQITHHLNIELLLVTIYRTHQLMAYFYFQLHGSGQNLREERIIVTPSYRKSNR